MAGINFPANPDVDDTFVVGKFIWRWNGTSWKASVPFGGRMPAGSTAQRPTVPRTGQIRLNTDIDAFEGYDGNAWRPVYGTIITTPVGVLPELNQEINANTTFTLEASEYFNLLGLDHASSDWQISTDPAFGTTEVNIEEDTSNLESYEVAGGISTGDTYYWRVRYRDINGNVSEFSDAIEFEIVPPPDTFGQSFGGGIYMGTVCAAGSCYYLIVAPNATGCARLFAWKTETTTTAGTASTVDGRANTYGPMDNATHPAGNFCATRTINGFSDWYLPAINELQTFYNNGATGSNESVIGSGEAFASNRYWSSTERNSNGACSLNFTNGFRAGFTKTCITSNCLRAVRREPI